MNRPLIWSRGAKAIAGQIGAFANAHAGVAQQQKNIATQIITAAELLLEKLILLSGERPWECLRWTRKILAPDQANEFRKLLRASQFVKERAQSDELVNVGGGRQGPHF